MGLFFTKTKCDRCGADLSVRTMSWFTEETICLDCSDKEKKLRADMKAKGIEPRSYEGCGYVPELDKV